MTAEEYPKERQDTKESMSAFKVTPRKFEHRDRDRAVRIKGGGSTGGRYAPSEVELSADLKEHCKLTNKEKPQLLCVVPTGTLAKCTLTSQIKLVTHPGLPRAMERSFGITKVECGLQED